MITLPAIQVNQFGVSFYQSLLVSSDVEKLVKFEVLSYGPAAERTVAGGAPRSTRSKVNWEFLERRITQSSAAYQRPVIRKKIGELVNYFLQCADSGALPAIPGSVLLVSDRQLEFSPQRGQPPLGSLQIPADEGILRVLDGQHRLLALHQVATQHNLRDFQVPSVIFDTLTADQIVELFVTINAKHTRLNPSHLISLAGRRLYRDEVLAAAHDVIRTLNEDSSSPLHGVIKVLGVGVGKVSQAPLAEELKNIFTVLEGLGGRKGEELIAHARRFFLTYFRQVARAFETAWVGRKYSIKTGVALRAFIRVVPDVLAAIRARRGDPLAASDVWEVVRPWRERIGDGRFETEGQWRQRLAGGTRSTVEILARELRSALAS